MWVVTHTQQQITRSRQQPTQFSTATEQMASVSGNVAAGSYMLSHQLSRRPAGMSAVF